MTNKGQAAKKSIALLSLKDKRNIRTSEVFAKVRFKYLPYIRQ